MDILPKFDVDPRFLNRLPCDALVMGRRVRIEADAERGFACTGLEVVSLNRPVEAIRNWEYRKNRTWARPELTPGYGSIVRSLGTREIVSEFLRFFLFQPIGSRMFILKNNFEEFSSHRCRIDAVDEALVWWYAIKSWTAANQRKLPIAVACGAYRSQIPKHEIQRTKDDLVPGILWTCMCGTSVTHSSGFCHHHRTPETKTLFNYYPWFASEGLPEFM